MTTDEKTFDDNLHKVGEVIVSTFNPNSESPAKGFVLLIFPLVGGRASVLTNIEDDKQCVRLVTEYLKSIEFKTSELIGREH